MDQALWAALCRFARGDNTVFGPDMGTEEGGAHAELDPNDPLTFARFCVYLAVHRLDLPVESFAQAFTEGRGELGFDGIVVSLGGEALPRLEVLEEAVENILQAREVTGGREGLNLGRVPQPRVLFVQAKRENVTPMREVDHFGASAERFVAFREEEFRALAPNEQVLNWWLTFDGVRQVFLRHGLAFEPEVDLVFAYAGRWTEPDGPEASRAMAERHLGHVTGPERVRYRMWGCDELVQAVEWTSKAVSGVLKSAALIQLPNGAAQAYIGFVPATSLVGLIPDVNGRPDDRVFLDNVRSFLGDEEEKGLSPNPGAVGLKHSLTEGEGGEVVLRHNGVTIVARGMEVLANGDLALREFQIVNGAQTSWVLFRNRDMLDGVHVPIKVVITEDEDVKNGVIVGANTQAPVGQYDMLSRVKEVRLLHQAFNAISGTRPEKIWLQRRRREWVPLSAYTELRFVTPRQLLEGFAAAFFGIPHRVLNEPGLLLQYVPGRIFSAGHDPSVYRAVGWMVVTGRRWAQANGEGKWGGTGERDPGGYVARHQYVFALRLLVDSDPGPLGEAMLVRNSKQVVRRFERICSLLAGPHGPQFGQAAGEVVQQVMGDRRINSAMARRREFTDQVHQLAMLKRKELESLRDCEPGILGPESPRDANLPRRPRDFRPAR